MNKEGEPMVVRASLLWVQVCAPKSWTKGQIEEWVNKEHPTGISSQWEQTTPAHAAEHGYPHCAQCVEHKSHHHVVLVC